MNELLCISTPKKKTVHLLVCPNIIITNTTASLEFYNQRNCNKDDDKSTLDPSSTINKNENQRTPSINESQNLTGKTYTSLLWLLEELKNESDKNEQRI
eukprot:Pgem_evm1s14407